VHVRRLCGGAGGSLNRNLIAAIVVAIGFCLTAYYFYTNWWLNAESLSDSAGQAVFGGSDRINREPSGGLGVIPVIRDCSHGICGLLATRLLQEAPMKVHSLFVCTVFALLFCNGTVDETNVAQNLEHVGFTLDAAFDRSILVIITRDTTKAHWPKRDRAAEISAIPSGSSGAGWNQKQKESHLRIHRLAQALPDTIFTVGEVQTANGQEDGERCSAAAITTASGWPTSPR
jgi:hypothetical protein